MKRSEIERAARASATKKYVDKGLRALQPGSHKAEVTFPAPVVQNHIPAPNVRVENRVEPTPIINQIDLGPLVEVIASIARTLVEAVKDMTEQTAQLCQIIAEKDLEFKPVINVPETKVEVKPEITVTVPEFPKRKARRARIKHSDNTESTITLEE